MKYAFIRKQGYRFTGVKVDADADDSPITVLASSEPPPTWKPDPGVRFDEQRAFAKRMLIRLWEKYGANTNEARGIECIAAMRRSTCRSPRSGRRSVAIGTTASSARPPQRNWPRPTVRETLAFLSKDRDSYMQSFIQMLADRYTASDHAKALALCRRGGGMRPAGWSRPGGRLPWHRPVPRWLDRGEPNADMRHRRGR